MHRSTVVAGIVLFASVAIAFVWIGTSKVDGDGSQYRWTAAKTDLDVLKNAVAVSARERGHLPTDAEGLISLVGGDHAFLDMWPRDPWHHPYVYRRTKAPLGFEIYSIGHNGQDESGGGDDIVTGEKSYRCEDYIVSCTFTLNRAAGMLLLLLIVSSLSVLAYRGALAFARIRDSAFRLRNRAN
jgi:hypothetical protein